MRLNNRMRESCLVRTRMHLHKSNALACELGDPVGKRASAGGICIPDASLIEVTLPDTRLVHSVTAIARDGKPAELSMILNCGMQ